MQEHRVKEFETVLRAERADLELGSAATAGDRAPVTLDQQAVGRLSRMDALQVQAMAQGQNARRRQRIGRIDAALARIAAGAYGACLDCGEEIPERRLAIDPAAPLCIGCASGG